MNNDKLCPRYTNDTKLISINLIKINNYHLLKFALEYFPTSHIRAIHNR